MSYASEVLADSPWGFWLLDETSGTSFADGSGSSRTLTLTGALSAYAVAGPGSLKGASFPANAGVYLQSAATVSAFSNAFTIEAWVFLTANPAANAGICGNGASGAPGTTSNHEFGLYINTSGQPVGHYYNGSAQLITSPDALTLNVWHQIVVTGDTSGGVVTMKVDKVVKVAGVSGTIAITGTRVFFVHGSYNAGAGAVQIGPVSTWASAVASSRTDAHYDQVWDLSSTGVTLQGALPINGGLIVSWKPVIGATGYDYRINGGSAVGVTNDPGKWNIQQVRITGLTNTTNYTVEVRPKNGISTGVWTTLSGGGTPSASGVTDAFTRADSAVTPGSPTTGGPYTVVVGTAGISSNKLYFPTATTGDIGAHLIVPGALDVDIQFTVSTAANTSNSLGIVFRYVSNGTCWIFECGGGNYRILQYVGTSQGNFLILPTAVVSGDVIRVHALGRNVTCFVNGQVQAEFIDNRYHLAGSYVGIRDHNASHRVDDFSVVEAQPLTAAGRIYKGRDTQALDLVGAA